MTIASKLALTCIAVTICLSGATTFAASKRHRSNALLMTIHLVMPGVCTFSFADQTFSLPEDEDVMLTTLRKLRRNWRSVSISGGIATPYRCVGHATYIAQRAGFKRGRFVAQQINR